MTARLKTRRARADSEDMPHGRPLPSVTDQRGFSLVEVMVAALILVVGVLGLFTMVDGANTNSQDANARLAATNLAREIIENARTIDYDKVFPGQLTPELQKRPNLAGTGNPWTLERRGVTYAIQIKACVFDEAKDGLAQNPPWHHCAPKPSPIAGAPEEKNPDDFRHVQVKLTWRRGGKTRQLTQTALVANPSGGLGPRIINFPEPSGQITSSSWPFTVRTTTASAVRWNADDAVSSGNAGGGPTDWGWTWNFGDPSTGPAVADGTYTVTAQAFDSRGIPGEARVVTVLLNRYRAFQPKGLDGGRNERHGGVVDVLWQANTERDLVGYHVYRIAPDGTRTRVCPASGEPPIQAVECIDRNPPAGELIYQVYAVDREVLGDLSSALRESETPAEIAVADTIGPKPPAPTNLQAAIVNGRPALQWSQPAGANVAFFRIYRDGDAPTLANRHDRTLTADTSYSDPAPGSTTVHRYWVTAVDESFNESEPSNFADTP